MATGSAPEGRHENALFPLAVLRRQSDVWRRSRTLAPTERCLRRFQGIGKERDMAARERERARPGTRRTNHPRPGEIVWDDGLDSVSRSAALPIRCPAWACDLGFWY